MNCLQVIMKGGVELSSTNSQHYIPYFLQLAVCSNRDILVRSDDGVNGGLPRGVIGVALQLYNKGTHFFSVVYQRPSFVYPFALLQKIVHTQWLILLKHSNVMYITSLAMFKWCPTPLGYKSTISSLAMMLQWQHKQIFCDYKSFIDSTKQVRYCFCSTLI